MSGLRDNDVAPPSTQAIEAAIDRLTPADAKRGAGMLWRLNDWLVDSGLGFVLDQDALQAFGGLAVKLQRRAAADEANLPTVDEITGILCDD